MRTRPVHIQDITARIYKVGLAISVHAGLVAKLFMVFQHVLNGIAVRPAFIVRAFEQIAVAMLFQPLEHFGTGTEVDVGRYKRCHDVATGSVQAVQQHVRIHHVTVDDDGRSGLFRRDGVVAGSRQRTRPKAAFKGGGQAVRIRHLLAGAAFRRGDNLLIKLRFTYRRPFPPAILALGVVAPLHIGTPPGPLIFITYFLPVPISELDIIGFVSINESWLMVFHAIGGIDAVVSVKPAIGTMGIAFRLACVVKHGKVFHVRVRQVIAKANGMDIDMAITLGSQELLIAFPCPLVIIPISFIRAITSRTPVRQEIRDIPCSVFDTAAQPVKPVGSRLKGRPIIRSRVAANRCAVNSLLQLRAEFRKT